MAKTRAQRQDDFTKNSNIISLNWWCNCGAANLAIIIYTRLQLRLLLQSLEWCNRLLLLRSVVATNSLSLSLSSFFQVFLEVCFALEIYICSYWRQCDELWSSLANRHGTVYECQLCLQNKERERERERERELSPQKNNHRR